MGLIYLIGGGEIGKRETYEVDRRLLSYCPKKHPRVLFVPAASHDSLSYVEAFSSLYEELGAEVEALYLYSDEDKDIKKKISEADIIYIGGGSSKELLTMIKARKIKSLLKKANDSGTILAGLSAGMNAYCSRCYCDNCTYIPGLPDFFFLDGLGFLPYCSTPHYEAREGFDRLLKDEKLPGLAIESGVALLFKDGKFVENWKCYGWDSHAYMFSRKNGKLIKKEIA